MREGENCSQNDKIPYLFDNKSKPYLKGILMIFNIEKQIGTLFDKSQTGKTRFHEIFIQFVILKPSL